MSDETRELPLDDPRILPFLPMLYVAWADGDLASEEVAAICARISAVDGLSGDCSRSLGRWLDARRPPDARDLHGLLAAVRGAAAALPDAERLSFLELGLEIARAAGHEASASELRALEEIQDALGLTGAETARRILAPARPAAPTAEPASAFDVAALTRLLDGEHRDVRVALRELLGGEGFREESGHGLDKRLSLDERRDRTLARCRELAGRGFGALAYPREYGGTGDLAGSIAAAETLALGDLGLFVKFGVQFGLFAGSVFQLGTARHHERYLRDAVTLDLPGCFAMTETDHGSNVAEIETAAVYNRDAGDFVIHTPHPGARKDYIGNAARHGRLATVFAQLEIDGESYGVHAFLVPIRDAEGRPLPGVFIEDCGEKMGLNGVDNGRLGFDRVRVPRDALLDRFAAVAPDGTYASPIASPSKRFFTMLGTLVGGRVAVALAGLSAAKTALAIAVRYGARRRQFGVDGRPETVLLDYLTHQRRLMPRLAAAYALDFALKHLVKRYAASPVDERRDVEALAAGLKALSTWNATETVQTCREACGGAGYLSVNRLPALKADSDVFTTFEGDNTVLLQLVAKGLLTGFRKQFADMGVLGMVRYAALRAAEVVGEYVSRHVTAEDELRDPDFQLAALRFRESHLLGALARRLRKRVESGMDGFEALVECQDHVLATAKAHVERVVAERFAAAIDEAGELAAVLSPLRDLHALWRIESDRAFFLAHGYFDGATSKAVRNAVNALCREVRGQAVPLVDAFGIPAAVLAAPIALPEPNG